MIGRAVVAVTIVSALSFAGCARTPVSSDQLGQAAGAGPVTPMAVPSPTDTPSVSPTPAPTTATPTPTPTPTNPMDKLSKKTRAEFKGCLDKTVGPGSSGRCAALVLKKLRAAKLYPWALSSRISMVGVNAILNYQRSRGLTPTGKTNKATWVALATGAPVVPTVLPKKCLAKGIVICVDQGHRKLFWLKNGKVVKTVAVRVGGYNYLKKKGQKQGTWRIYPTANGTWKVYDKQVDPKSENYGSGAMPYSTMFYPDMYVHYSPGFHSVGYAGSSHGCVNVGKLADAVWIFKHTPIGTKVHVFTPKVKTS
jgi:lipoprotein-anchoring transpeptidase ErfK/SrfK